MKRVFIPLFAFALLLSAQSFADDKPAETHKSNAERLAEINDPELKKLIGENLKRAKERYANDSKKHSAEDLKAFEELYKSVTKGGIEGRTALLKLVNKFPDLDRTGCAVMQYAALCKGYERSNYWNMAQRDFSDCYFMNGVSVGALARYHLAREAFKNGDVQKGQRLLSEIKSKFPDAINGRWQRLLSEDPAKDMPQAAPKNPAKKKL